MPRLPRHVVPDVPLHITHRGIDRRATFLQPEDFASYRWALRDAALGAGCAIHAYVLMTNHVHLLVTPSESDAPARMMRSLGARYVPRFNARIPRSGALWEGRYHSTRIDRIAYLFACSRYIELNPVRAGMVGDPGAYTWSSYHCNAWNADDPIITVHRCIADLGASDESRCAAYRALFAVELDEETIAAIRATRRGRPRGRPWKSERAVGLPPDTRITAGSGDLLVPATGP